MKNPEFPAEKDFALSGTLLASRDKPPGPPSMSKTKDIIKREPGTRKIAKIRSPRRAVGFGHRSPKSFSSL